MSTPTPITDSISRTATIDGVVFVPRTEAAKIESLLAESESHRKFLARWREEKLQVEDKWSQVDQFVRDHPEARIGAFVAETALQWLKDRDSLTDAVIRYHREAKAFIAMAEKLDQQQP